MLLMNFVSTTAADHCHGFLFINFSLLPFAFTHLPPPSSGLHLLALKYYMHYGPWKLTFCSQISFKPNLRQ